MATAKKLPSGSWRIRVYSHTEDGKKVYRSFTSDDPSPKGKRKVELEAAQFAAEQERKKHSAITVGDAIERYITSKASVVSPSTLRGYRSLQKQHYKPLERIQIDRLTDETVQLWISDISVGRSPKTVRNIYTLLSSAVNMFDRSVRLDPELPAKQQPDLYTPIDKDVQRLIDHVRGKDLEICICLAAFGPMRRGEICALESGDINGNVVTVRRAMVLGPDKQWCIKQPKTYAGYREIEYPREVIALMSGRQGRLFDFTPDALSNRFKRAVIYAGLHHFRFHDLRHYSASIQHAMGIPDEYIMARGGWASDYVMKRVYRHALSDKERQYNDKVSGYFGRIQKQKTKKV